MNKNKEAFPHVLEANQYARQVVNNEIIVCKWIKLACQRHLNDCEKVNQADYPFYFDNKAAERFMRFVEYLPHTKGKWAAKGESIKLQPWQKFAVGLPFSWLRKKII